MCVRVEFGHDPFVRMAGWPGSWSIIKLIEDGMGAKLVLPPIMEPGHGDTTRQRRFDKAERTAARLGLEASLRPGGRPGKGNRP